MERKIYRGNRIMGNKVTSGYEINIPEGTDSTTAISSISYEMEKMIIRGLDSEEISRLIQEAVREDRFPSNLQYIDSYHDEVYGTSGCAFLDTNTGKVVLGYAGTNWDADGLADIRTDIGIALGSEGSLVVPFYFDAAIKFYDQLVAAGYDDIIVTGHSLGGNIAVIVGIHGDVKLIVTYNGAPMYGLPSATAAKLEQRLSQFEGRIIRFVSEEDWLNNMSITFGGTYAGELYVLYNGNGHDLAGFMEK